MAAVRSNGEGGGPRRSALLQTRSRNTRRKLIRTALDLWNERGFERGIEEVTAEEIARAAGVTKGTFYFHFAHKEDILLEMGWATAEAMIDEAEAGMRRGDSTPALLDRLMTSLARRVARAPRVAVLRAAGNWSRLYHTETMPAGARGFKQAYDLVLCYAVERGDLPVTVDTDDLATVFQAITMDTLVAWAASQQTPTALRNALRRRAAIILAGASQSPTRTGTFE